MLIKCVSDDLSVLEVDPELRAELLASYQIPGEKVNLTVNNFYTVYAISIYSGTPRYFIADDVYRSLRYPVPYHSCFFEVIDSRLSQSWRYGFERIISEGNSRINQVIIAFPEWKNNIIFYENLLNGDANAASTFASYKSLIDFEFPHPLVTLSAIMSDDEWLICPKCSNAWENKSCGAIIQCTQCLSLLQNPLSVYNQIAQPTL